MKHIFFTLLTISIALLISGCERPVKNAEYKAISSEIDLLMAEVLKDAENLQTTALESYLDDGPLARFFLNSKTYRKEPLIQELKRHYAQLTSQKLIVIDPSAIVISRNGVLWTAQISALGTDKDGKQQSNSYSQSWVWQKKDDHWKIVHFNDAWVNR